MTEPCKEWTGRRDKDGYAMRGGAIRVAREVFQQTHGWLPPVVMHTCDNPPCVEPTHLVAGTSKLNTLDMMLKGRAKFAGRCFTPDQVTDIIRRVQAGEVQRAIARELKVHPTTINRIVRERTWKGVVTNGGGTH